jgi:hypothetical protein
MPISLSNLRTLLLPGLKGMMVQGPPPFLPEPEPMPKFTDGDMVILNRQNPFKGCLKGETPYRVIGAHETSYGFYHLLIQPDNNSPPSFFLSQHFSLHCPASKMEEAASEYEDILVAQDLMDSMK